MATKVVNMVVRDKQLGLKSKVVVLAPTDVANDGCSELHVTCIDDPMAAIFTVGAAVDVTFTY